MNDIPDILDSAADAWCGRDRQHQFGRLDVPDDAKVGAWSGPDESWTLPRTDLGYEIPHTRCEREL